ncbi:hypothetical protein N9241_02000 [bacterium]|nr:hypothetical protein [bacterium]
MFKIFTVFSLIALLAEGSSAPQSSPWGLIVALMLMTGIMVLVGLWLRRRYRIVRRAVHDKFRKANTDQSVIKPEIWDKITSGEMARKLLGEEKP